MGKGKDAKKNVKKEAAKTPKEKKAEKRAKKNQQFSERTKLSKLIKNLLRFLDYTQDSFRVHLNNKWAISEEENRTVV